MLSLSGLSPAEGANNIELDSDIELTIIDDGSGIDTSSIIINILGNRALTGVEFQNNYNGSNSEISFSGNNIVILIDPESDFSKEKVVDVQIQAKNLDGEYFNYTYAFKTIPEKPVLLSSSPEHQQVITSPQYLYFEFIDEVDGIDESSINIDIEGIDYVIEGSLQTSILGFLSEITDNDAGTGVIVRLDPLEPFRDGTYTINYSVNDSNGNNLTDKLEFDVKVEKVALPPAFPQTGFVGYYQGVRKASDYGDGKTIHLTWNQIATRSYQSEGFALIYQNDKRLEIFDSQPSYIANVGLQEALITNLISSKTYSFAVRAMESYLNTIELDGMEKIDNNGIYIIPEPTTVRSTVSASDNIIYVSSVQGYPSKGFLFIGREIIRYNGLLEDDNAFLVSPSGRGVSDTTPGIYLSGDEIKLFLQCTDNNTVIVMGTPTYQDGYELDRTVNNVGLVVTDYSDTDNKYVMPFDFCGYHRARPDQFLNGKEDCGSYLGGEYNGFRGMNLFDRLVANEEILLNNTGEPIILLRRIWNGTTCSCSDPRRIHPKVKSCNSCYGTTYNGGYLQYDNKRRNDTLVMVSFADTVEDVKLGSYESLQQEMEPSAWTIPIPAIRDRDLLIRFDYTGDIEFIYEVLNVSREKSVFRHFTRQRLALKRLDKTDIVYTFPFIKPSNIGQQ